MLHLVATWPGSTLPPFAQEHHNPERAKDREQHHNELHSIWDGAEEDTKGHSNTSKYVTTVYRRTTTVTVLLPR